MHFVSISCSRSVIVCYTTLNSTHTLSNQRQSGITHRLSLLATHESFEAFNAIQLHKWWYPIYSFWSPEELFLGMSFSGKEVFFVQQFENCHNQREGRLTHNANSKCSIIQLIVCVCVCVHKIGTKYCIW